jgi:XisH protein
MAKDKYHNLVKKALQDLGWTVTNDPFYIPTLKRKLEIDLGAERVIAAEKDNQKIAIEIKSFVGLSEIHEFYKALGQFNYYQLALEEHQIERVLYLAVPSDIYDTLFTEPLTLKAIERYNIKIIVYNIQNENIEKWIN